MYNCNSFQHMCIFALQRTNTRAGVFATQLFWRAQSISTRQPSNIESHIFPFNDIITDLMLFSPDIINYTTHRESPLSSVLSFLCNLRAQSVIVSHWIGIRKHIAHRSWRRWLQERTRSFLSNVHFSKLHRAYLSLLFCTHHCQRRPVKRQPQWGIVENKI